MEIQQAIACFAISHKHTKPPFCPCYCVVENVLLGSLSKHEVRIPVTILFDFIQLYLNLICYVTSVKPMLYLSTCFFCKHSNSSRWYTLMSPSAGSNQNATGFLETQPVCKTQTYSARYSSLSSSYPFLFCHLSTSPHCGNPSQVRTKWVTQGGSQLEHARPHIRYLLDSASAWAYGQTQNVLAIWQALCYLACYSLTRCGPFHTCRFKHTRLH